MNLRFEDLVPNPDVEMVRLRANMPPGKRIQAMLDAHELIVALMRGRLRSEYPDMSAREINLKIIEELESAKQLHDTRPFTISRDSA